jgi:glycosyltransferase involved in cell wall biosynthesis
MFPQRSETFIANEILALERLGVRVHIYSYRRPVEHVPHECLTMLRGPTTYLPDRLFGDISGLLGAHLSVYLRSPPRYWKTLSFVVAHSLRDRNHQMLRRFLQAVLVANLGRRDRVRHFHAHFAHGSTRVAMLASMLTGMPYSFTSHARDIFADHVDYDHLGEKMRSARFAVTVSQYNKAFLQQKLNGSVNGQLRVVYNGVDLQKFSPNTGPREPDLVLAVGRLIEKKGFSHLIEACRLLAKRGRRFRCEIVGDGDLHAELQRQIEASGLEGRVALVGALSQEELRGYYDRAALLVMPAVQAANGDRDALPTVVIEAMACGLPVVSFDCPSGPGEIIDHDRNGLLVAPGDVAGLAAALDRLLGSPAQRARLGAAAREIAVRLAPEVVLERWSALLPKGKELP